jgi:hypothetical protein
MSEKILLTIIGAIAVLATFGVAGVLTAIAIACDPVEAGR